MKKRLNDKLLF